MRRKKLAPAEPPAWDVVARYMRQSITGRGLTTDELRYLERAMRVDPKKYSALHAEIKAEEIRRERMPWTVG